MEKFRKIRFQNYALLYSMCLMGVFLLIAFVFVLNIKIDIPEQIQGYYVSVDGAVLTENGLMIPLDELEKSIVTE